MLETRAFRFLLNFSAVAASLFTVPAFAQVMQPSGEVMPQPTRPEEVKVVTDRGFPPDAVTLDGLFRYRGEMLNPVANASTTPGVFSPLCGFTGTLLLRGGSCQVAFGWYNVTPGSTTPPPDSEIYELVPANTSTAFMCRDNDFCPLATMMTTQVGQHEWVPQTFDAANIRADPRYRGGLVGFAIVGAAGTNCPQTKFSQAELNVKSPSGAPWITTLVYQSTATPDAFYVAFEDLPLLPSTWRGNQGGFQNDGDFNDFVYFITGLTCEGGGQPCDASLTNPALQGACALGRTGCSVAGGGAPACNPVLQPSGERCDNLDNDCNGVVDDGEGLCPAGQVCDLGTCVSACNTGEFRCRVGLTCNAAGFCIDPLCADVVCEAGQVCRAGTCTGGCGGNVVCPRGQECQIGRCVDLCAGVQCAENQVCERGLCISSCSCRQCPNGTVCAADGRCLDAGCENITCPAGQYCAAGACTDACTGVVCPGGAACENGQCGEPLPGDNTGTGGNNGGGPPVGSGGIVIGGGAGPGSGANSGRPSGGDRPTADGCGCRVIGTEDRASNSLAMLGGALGAFLLLRRRRSERARPRRAA